MGDGGGGGRGVGEGRGARVEGVAGHLPLALRPVLGNPSSLILVSARQIQMGKECAWLHPVGVATRAGAKGLKGVDMTPLAA